MNKDIEMSIELGYLGFTPKEYYEKRKSVMKVRRRLKLELTGFFIFISMSIYFLFYSYKALFFKLAMIICVIVLSIAIIKNLAVWNEIFDIKKERFDEYEKLKGLKLKYKN